MFSQDTLSATYRAVGEARQYDSGQGRVSGLTPFPYAAGVLPNLYDEQVSATILAGRFGSEVALIADASERSDGLTLAGSDSIQAQAVLIRGCSGATDWRRVICSWSLCQCRASACFQPTGTRHFPVGNNCNYPGWLSIETGRVAMKAPVAAAIAIAFGLVVLAGYFLPLPGLISLRNILVQWSMIVASTAPLFGCGELAACALVQDTQRRHCQRIQFSIDRLPGCNPDRGGIVWTHRHLVVMDIQFNPVPH